MCTACSDLTHFAQFTNTAAKGKTKDSCLLVVSCRLLCLHLFIFIFVLLVSKKWMRINHCLPLRCRLMSCCVPYVLRTTTKLSQQPSKRRQRQRPRQKPATKALRWWRRRRRLGKYRCCATFVPWNVAPVAAVSPFLAYSKWSLCMQIYCQMGRRPASKSAVLSEFQICIKRVRVCLRYSGVLSIGIAYG